jgi:hypothetical protein
MVDTIAIGAVVLAFGGLLFARQLLSSIKMLVANAVGGIITLVVASWFGFGISISAVTLAITALAGIPGALLVVLLAHGGFAFVPPGAEESGGILAGQAAENLQQLLDRFQEFADFVETSNNASSEASNLLRFGKP